MNNMILIATKLISIANYKSPSWMDVAKLAKVLLEINKPHPCMCSPLPDVQGNHVIDRSMAKSDKRHSHTVQFTYIFQISNNDNVKVYSISK